MTKVKIKQNKSEETRNKRIQKFIKSHKTNDIGIIDRGEWVFIVVPSYFTRDTLHVIENKLCLAGAIIQIKNDRSNTRYWKIYDDFSVYRYLVST